MNCPECNSKLEVINVVRDTDDIYRRRRCKVCGKLVYTHESEVIPDAAYRSNWTNLVNNSRNRNKEEKKNND